MLLPISGKKAKDEAKKDEAKKADEPKKAEKAARTTTRSRKTG
jgi:DNA end-binding protein Ku